MVIFSCVNLLFVPIGVKAKNYENIKFENFTIEQGLPQATVETMVQDKRGYLWIGTNDGLARYNGYEFKVYRNEIGINSTIVGNYIVDLKIDKDNNLWAATTTGLSKIDLNTYNIRNYTEEDGLKNVNITCILVNSENHILIATSNGLYVYNNINDDFSKIDLNDNYFDNIKINSLNEDSNGFIWVGSNNGLFKIDINSSNECMFLKKINEINDGVYNVYCNDDSIYVGTFESGLYIVNIETSSVTVMNTNNSSMPSNSVRKIIKDSRGIIWIGTQNGLVKYNLDDKNIDVYKNLEYDSKSLVNNYVYSILEDKSGLMWIGTYGGLSCFDSENKIEHYKVSYNSKFTINDNMIHGIYEDENGLIYLGTNQNGLNILDRNNKKVDYITTNTQGMSLVSNSISDVDGYENYIFVGTNEGLNIIDVKNKTCELYNEKDGLINKKIKCLHMDSKGKLWIGTANGMYTLDIETKKLNDLTYILEENEIEDKYIETIYEDKSGVYWIGSFRSGGLTKIDLDKNIIKNYKYIKGENSISNNSVRTIIQDNDGYLWIGTSGGLNKLDIEKEKFQYYTTLDGLPNNTIYGILLDSNDDLWMSTNHGISYYNKKQDRFSNLNTNDGLQSNEFNGASYYRSKSGEMMFAGINGLNIFMPEGLFAYTYISNVEFDEFKINGVEVRDIDKQKLSYNDNTISVKVFVPNYKNIDNIKYYFRLKGSDDEWIPMDTNEVTLSNLSSGQYVFEVKARNSDGSFSEVNSFSFEVKPVFWKSKAAIFMYFIIIFLTVILILGAKNEKMKILNIMVDERTKKLNDEMQKNTQLLNKVISLEKNKNSYFVNISHELRTPLNVLSSIEQVIRELNKSENGIEKDKINHYMDISKANISRLLKLINDIVDSSKIEHGNYKLQIEKNDIVYIVEETALSLKDYVERKGIELIIDPKVEECIIDCDKNEIERCIINLINNAAKFTGEYGKILVSLEESDDKVIIEVSDTGIGIEEEYLETIFDRFNQVVDQNRNDKKGSGLGLTITRLIINLHKGSITVKSKVNEGSTFTIILPKHYE